jgi:hypothetical protein
MCVAQFLDHVRHRLVAGVVHGPGQLGERFSLELRSRRPDLVLDLPIEHVEPVGNLRVLERSQRHVPLLWV